MSFIIVNSPFKFVFFHHEKHDEIHRQTMQIHLPAFMNRKCIRYQFFNHVISCLKQSVYVYRYHRNLTTHSNVRCFYCIYNHMRELESIQWQITSIFCEKMSSILIGFRSFNQLICFSDEYTFIQKQNNNLHAIFLLRSV